jgi:excisionase family DNA binding protein
MTQVDVADPDAPAFYSPADVQRLLRVSASTVTRLMRSGALPTVKIGRCRRVPARALGAYVAQLLEGDA